MGVGVPLAVFMLPPSLLPAPASAFPAKSQHHREGRRPSASLAPALGKAALAGQGLSRLSPSPLGGDQAPSGLFFSTHIQAHRGQGCEHRTSLLWGVGGPCQR